MKFYGITMQGKFINQTLADVPPIFDPTQDTGRLIYNNLDGFLWWGDGRTDAWRSIGEGKGDASEAEDMYSDLLRGSIFKNCTWNEFWQNMDTDPFVNESNSSDTLRTNWDSVNKSYDFTITGETIESNDLHDTVHVNLTNVSYCMPSVFWLDAHPHSLANAPIIQVSNGNGWENAVNNAVHKFPSAGTELKIKVTSQGTGVGTLYSWGVLYSKDLSVSCSHYALTQNLWTIENDITTTLNYQYIPGFILVYLNGLLLQDVEDYTAIDGENIVFAPTALQTDDVVYVMTFGTSTFDSSSASDLYIKRDASTSWDAGVEQDAGTSKITNLGDGTVTGDSIHYGQFEQSSNIIIFPGGTFMAWGIYDNGAVDDGYPVGVTGTIDPKIYSGNGAVVGARTLSIRDVQLTYKGDNTAAPTGAGEYLRLKTEFIDGNTTFNWTAYRDVAGTDASIRFSWHVTGQVA